MSKGRMSRMEAMSLAFEFAVKSGIEGDYYEFGVYRGNSLVNALRAREQVAARFGRLVCPRLYAFDSFAGLPPLTDADKLDGYDAFDEGTYACSQKEVEEELRKAGVSVHDLRFVPGFYDQSLKAADTLRLIQSSVAAIVHIDCDLYSSAADCLAFLNGCIQDGTVLLLDDWFCYRGRPDRGVRGAFNKWLPGTAYSGSEYFRYSWAGIAFILNTQ